MSEWSRKELHGLHWGHWQRKPTATDWRIHRDNFEPCYDVSGTSGQQVCVKFGNEWASKPGDPFYGQPFQHPSDYQHDNWYFWDNPEIPQFLWRTAANPTGDKSWARWVKGNCFSNPHQHGSSGTARINSLLREFSRGKITHWEQIAPVRTVKASTTKRVLITPVSAPNYEHYYGITQNSWLERVTKYLRGLDLDYDIRQKPGRKQRIGNQLTDQLASDRYCATISQHSASAVESILAGVPCVVTGPHPAGELATTWQEFLDGDLRTPHPDEVRAWCDVILSNVRHKRELVQGAWHD